MYIRKKIRSSIEDKNSQEAFKLDDLKKMRDNGQISEEEFKTLRARMIQNMM